jgi:hypothetical protein
MGKAAIKASAKVFIAASAVFAATSSMQYPVPGH